ncbi:hypothetical protein LUZ60_004636 [Juncus effusus]|nr:hypothetical protein LUZ60_004636 [Juncus effusus]
MATCSLSPLFFSLRPLRRVQVICGPRGNRPAIQRGRILSSESILAIQALKRVTPDRPFPTQTFARLLKPDLVSIIGELNRQNLPDLALSVFEFLRTDPSYRTDLALYSSTISAFAEEGGCDNWELKVDQLALDLLEEKMKNGGFGTDERMKVTRVLKALIKAKRGESVKRVYAEIKRSEFVGDEYFYRVLARGLKRLGEDEAAQEVETDFKAWWYEGSAQKVLDEMPKNKDELSV